MKHTTRKATRHVNQNEGLIFEKSSAGKAAWKLPPLDVPEVDTAKLLGISSDELGKDLQSGKTLGDLAKQKGVSSSDLLASVEKSLKASAPQGAPSLSNGQLEQVASGIINGTPPAAPGGQAGGGEKASENLSRLADAVGADPSTLLQQLMSGQELSSLLGTGGSATRYGSAAAGLTSGVTVDRYA